jgi:alanyl-tRNA synthetase
MEIALCEIHPLRFAEHAIRCAHRMLGESQLVHSTPVTQCAFQCDAYLTELDTEVIEVGVEDGRPYAITADTVFYAEGGGQPADRGTIGAVDVVDVRNVEGVIRHYVSAQCEVGPVHMEIDWDRRYDHMQQHSAQHMITALAHARFGWPTTAFHLGPTVSDIELDRPSLAGEELARLEDVINAEIRAARPVRVRYAATEKMAELGVRSRLLPQDFVGDELRLVEIEGVDLNTCGGTHVRSTAEIGGVAFVGTEPMRGGTRVFFVAGNRVLRRLAEHEARNARLRSILDSADDDLPEIVQLRIDKEKRLSRDRRRLAEELIDALVALLAADPETVVSHHRDDRDMEFLQKLGRRLAEVAPDKIGLLTAGTGNEGLFVVAAGTETGLDIAEVGREAAALLDGRGGGARCVFQGKASNLGQRDAAKELLRRRS